MIVTERMQHYISAIGGNLGVTKKLSLLSEEEIDCLMQSAIDKFLEEKKNIAGFNKDEQEIFYRILSLMTAVNILGMEFAVRQQKTLQNNERRAGRT